MKSVLRWHGRMWRTARWLGASELSLSRFGPLALEWKNGLRHHPSYSVFENEQTL